jgi:hypothetical protein
MDWIEGQSYSNFHFNWHGSAVEKEAGAFLMIPTGSGLQGRK